MDEVEIGKCDMCGRRNVALFRKYYYYNIDCECCSGQQHFEIVKYCSGCVPEPPSIIRAHIKPISNRIG